MKDVRITLAAVWRSARWRAPGYLDAVLENSTQDGDTLVIAPEAYDRLKNGWPEQPGIRGLGDVVKVVLKPLVKASDSLLGTDLQNCPGCEDRRQALNDRFPMGK